MVLENLKSGLQGLTKKSTDQRQLEGTQHCGCHHIYGTVLPHRPALQVTHICQLPPAPPGSCASSRATLSSLEANGVSVSMPRTKPAAAGTQGLFACFLTGLHREVRGTCFCSCRPALLGLSSHRVGCCTV